MTYSTQRLHAVVHGVVQGVNFRTATLRQAQKRGLTGWVRNRTDGTVEIFAEGDADSLRLFAEFLSQGPPAARVTRVDAEWGPPEGTFPGFEIRFSPF